MNLLIQFLLLSVYFTNWARAGNLEIVTVLRNTTTFKSSIYSSQNGQPENEKKEVEVKNLYTKTSNYITSDDIFLNGFEKCELRDCQRLCGSSEPLKGFCDPKNSRLCMCSEESFMSSNVDGDIKVVNKENPRESKCSVACNIRSSYARLWHRNDNSTICTCIINQITDTRITLCDGSAMDDICKEICRNDQAVCAFNGVCLCRATWPMVFHRKLANFRNEIHSDSKECSRLCKQYHTEYSARIYDKHLQTPGASTYEFRDKYCTCGEEIEMDDNSLQIKLHSQGFQECTGLKCKMRCGMNMEAECEPKHRRACYCPRNNIFIGKYLWARLPGKKESLCVESCVKAGLSPRVIEWNPFYDPANDPSIAAYRSSGFPYLYDGKFCHCITLKREPDINQFRPCTNELCEWLCGHHGATCDEKTRRVCMCNTHQMVSGLGRKPDPGEKNCYVICRRYLSDARVIDVIWDIPPPHWTVSRAKFCGCVRPVSPAGLRHCDGSSGNALCQKICNSTEAYCTTKKVCQCQHHHKILLKNSIIRHPTGKEDAECGEICRSWTFPVAQDFDHVPLIYDEERIPCSQNNSCPIVDTSPWTLTQPGALQISIDALEESPESPKKFCLCSKNEKMSSKPGIRIPIILEPPRVIQQPNQTQCIINYKCIQVSDTLHIVGKQ